VSGPLPAGERGTGSLHRSVAPNASSTNIHSTETPISGRVAADSHIANMQRKLSAGEFNTAMVHFYRGEVQRSNTWRNRLDTTTNWAVITAGATLSFAFSANSNPHFVILINSVLVAFFLFMEARRYRYYEIWSSRVRILETEYFARMLSPDIGANSDWADHLAGDLMTPHFTISEWEAVGRRLRRNYLWIFALLAASWNLKVYLHPFPARSFDEFIERASVGVVPGEMVFSVGVIFNVGLLVFALATVSLREATGEVLPRHQFSLRTFTRMTNWTPAALQRRTTLRRAQKARARTRTRSSGTNTGEWKRPEREHASEEVTSDR
jgi:uncharacterized membrane protein